MSDFNQKKGRRSRPIRRSIEYQEQDDNLGLEPVAIDQWDLSEEGSIDHRRAVRTTFYQTCGCTTSAPVGGRCGVCNLTSCAAHFLTCSECGIGICSLDTRMIEIRSLVAPYCPECANWSAPMRMLTRVFDLFGGEQ